MEPQSAPDNDAVSAHICNDANCTCHEPDFPHAKLAILDEKISSPRWVVPVLPDQELEALMQAAIALCRTGKYFNHLFKKGLSKNYLINYYHYLKVMMLDRKRANGFSVKD